MSGHIPKRLDQRVRERADNQCEYCHLSQKWQEAKFHVDHVIPRAAGGETTYKNLALACVSCSLRKGARQRARDPQSKTEVPLFNPREDVWGKHFQVTHTCRIQGRTPRGRATVTALAMNRAAIVAIRRELKLLDRAK